MLKKVWLCALAAAIILLASFWLQKIHKLEAAESRFQIPEGVYIDLTRDFYEALQRGDGTAARTYSNDPRNEYLRRIAVATEFTVKTNLTIIQQQEKIIELLQGLHRQGQQGR